MSTFTYTPPRSDEDLISSVLAGQKKSFNPLMERYYPYALRLAGGYTDCEVTAQDICQETFIRAYEKLGDFRQTSKFSTWLFTIVRTTALNMLAGNSRRRTNRDTLGHNYYEKDGIVSTSAAMDSQIDNRIFYAAFNQLPAQDALILRLYHLQEKSVGEVAELVQTAPATLRTQLCRARVKLRHLLQNQYGGELQFPHANA